MSRLGNWWDMSLYPTYLRPEHRRHVQEMLVGLETGAQVLNLGSGRQSLGAGVVNLDLIVYPEVNIQADAHRLPFPDEAFNAVIALALLEHVDKPWEVVREMERVLKPGGVVYIEAPFLQPYHADPGDYFRYTVAGLREIFSAFKEHRCGVLAGPASAVNWLVVEMLGILLDRRGTFDDLGTHFATRGFLWAKRAAQILLWPLKYLDHWLVQREHAYVLASGVYYWGHKP